MADDPKDPAQLGNIVTNLPGVRAAKTINPNSRAYRRLIRSIGEDEVDDKQRLSFQHTVFLSNWLAVPEPRRRGAAMAAGTGRGVSTC